MPQTPGRDLAPIADPSHNLLAVAEKLDEVVDCHPAGKFDVIWVLILSNVYIVHCIVFFSATEYIPMRNLIIIT